MKDADGQLQHYLKPGDGVLDIGANQGMLSAAYSRAVGPTGFVLAVEPNPETFADLQWGTREMPNVKPFHAAVGSYVGQTSVYPDGVTTSRWSALVEKQREPVTVPMVTLDILAAMVPRLRGVKIDVQGAEVDVLAGAHDTLRLPEVVWQVELWPRGLKVAGASIAAFCDALESVGLVPFQRTWATVRQQAEGLSAGGSYLDVVCRHVH